VQRHWGDTWWRLTTGVAGHYNAASTSQGDDETNGVAATQSAAAEPALTGIR